MSFCEKDTPNILLITADQLRWDFVSAYHANCFMQTPAIDRLADEGRVYERAYSPNPVCIPARYNLMTGLTARSHGFDDNYFEENAKSCPWYLPTFAQILSDHGYNTAAIGKMHFQPERRATGFDLFENCNEVVKDIEEDEYAKFLRDRGFGSVGSIHGVRNVLYMQPQQSLLPEECHSSSWVADRSIHYLRNRKTRTKPFLLWAGFIHPHPPLDIPHDWAHRYDGKIPRHTDTVTPLSKIGEENKTIVRFENEASLNRMRELYACAVSFMDYNIGRILKTLDEEGLAENTLVAFVSDHGEMLGDLGTYQKFLPYDASSRIPMILRWPKRIEAGSRVTDFADLNDLLPTFLDAAGAEYPAEYDLPGESLLSKAAQKDRSLQYIEHQHGSKRWCCIMDTRYKYVHCYGDEDQLFDMREDPDETENLLYQCQDEMIQGIRNRLKRLLIEYEARYGLDGCVQDGEFAAFPPYEANGFRDCLFPFSMVRDPADPPLNSLLEEIQAAKAQEPLATISPADADEILRVKAGFAVEEIDSILYHQGTGEENTRCDP